MKNWKMLPLTLLPGVERLVNSNKELRDKMTKLMFTQKGDFNNIDWSKTKIFVPGDATTAVWLKKAIKEIADLLSAKPGNAKPGIVYMGGNHSRYEDASSLETQLATALCEIQGYELTPFIKGKESVEMHKIVAQEVPDSVFKSVEFETESTNIKQGWENTLDFDESYFDDVKNVIVLAPKEYVTRCIGTLKATLKAKGLRPDDFNIYAWPYVRSLSAENLKILQKELGVNLKVPDNGGMVDEQNWFKSAFGLYYFVMEVPSLCKYSGMGHVALTDEQKVLRDYVAPRFTKPRIILEAAKAKTEKLPVVNKLVELYKKSKQRY